MKPDQLSEALRAVEDARIAARLAAETIAAQQAEMRRLEQDNVRLVREHALLALKCGVLIVAAGAAYDYFTDKTDADFDGGHFIGNREASLASELAEAIRRAKGERL